MLSEKNLKDEDGKLLMNAESIEIIECILENSKRLADHNIILSYDLGKGDVMSIYLNAIYPETGEKIGR